MMGAHKMNQFAGLQRIDGFHFHDMEKDMTAEKIEKEKNEYLTHLRKVFSE